jgi:tetratricopeptide (TPR) repeat protein
MKKISEMGEIERTLFLAFLHLSVGNVQKALSTYNLAYEAMQGKKTDVQSRRENLLNCILGLGQCYLQLQDVSSARKALHRAYEIVLDSTSLPGTSIYSFQRNLQKSGKIGGISLLRLATVYLFHARVFIGDGKPELAYDPLITARSMILDAAESRLHAPNQKLLECTDLWVKAMLAHKLGKETIKAKLTEQQSHLYIATARVRNNEVIVLNWQIEYLSNAIQVERHKAIILELQCILLKIRRRKLYQRYISTFTLR